MIPAPTKVGPFWRRLFLECHCMAFDFMNPHGWATHYCPPTPTAPDGSPHYRKRWDPPTYDPRQRRP
jgi:hypothetical protein